MNLQVKTGLNIASDKVDEPRSKCTVKYSLR